MRKKEARYIVNEATSKIQAPKDRTDSLKEHINDIDTNLMSTLREYFNAIKIHNTETNLE